MWKRSEVDFRKRYRVLLYEGAEGERLSRLIDEEELREISSSSSNGLLTEVVPNDLLWNGDILGISERVFLEGGERFYVDAHGLWFTAAEEAQWESGVDLLDIVWSTKKPPRFAPK